VLKSGRFVTTHKIWSLTSLEKIEKAFGIPKYRYLKKLLEQIENNLHKRQKQI